MKIKRAQANCTAIKRKLLQRNHGGVGMEIMQVDAISGSEGNISGVKNLVFLFRLLDDGCYFEKGKKDVLII